MKTITIIIIATYLSLDLDTGKREYHLIDSNKNDYILHDSTYKEGFYTYFKYGMTRNKYDVKVLDGKIVYIYAK